MYVDVVESFVVNVEGFVGVFDKLVNGESSVVRFNDGVRDFGGGNNREGSYYVVGEFFMDFGDKECIYIGIGIIIEGVSDLEVLEVVVVFGFMVDNI